MNNFKIIQKVKILLTLIFISTIILAEVNINYKTIQLSYIQTDRAAAVLKSLGFNVVDYRTEKGPNPFESIYKPASNFANNLRNGTLNDSRDLPIVIMLPETENITLLEMQGALSDSPENNMNVDMGGSSLIHSTTAEPLQRLMIVYDADDPKSLSRLINVIVNEIDVSAKQIIIEALIVEVESNKINEIGMKFNSSGSGFDLSTPLDKEDGVLNPFNFVVDKSLIGNSVDFDAKLSSLISGQNSDILSRPSVLVLDGRQARIVIGQQIPISKSVSNGQNITASTEYIPIGIVLNIRPRINRHSDKITMQVETIISSVSSSEDISKSDILEAPTFDSRKVQTYVQVKNNTPFIIGGLTSKNNNNEKGKIPFLSSIPIIGKIFQYKQNTKSQKEIIIVITPHIIDVDNQDFTRLIPKDDDIFQSLDNMLFKNIYRIQHIDAFDLDFVTNNDQYKNTIIKLSSSLEKDERNLAMEKYSTLLDGVIPGQEILIKRMLYNIIQRSEHYKHIDPENILFFETIDGQIIEQRFSNQFKNFLKVRPSNKTGLIITLENHSAIQKSSDNTIEVQKPLATTSTIEIPKQKLAHYGVLKNINQFEDKRSILIQDSSHERILYETLILRRVLQMNPGILDNISNFTPGLEIVFPSAELIESDTHIIDYEITKNFYEILFYNQIFEKRYVREMNEIITTLNQ